MLIKELFQRTFLGNTLESYCWFVGIILLGVLFKRLLSKLLALCVFKFLQKYSKGIGYDRLLLLLKKPLGLLILLTTFYLAFDRIHFPEEWNLVAIEQFGLRLILMRLFQIMIVINITWIVLRVIDFLALVLSLKAASTETKTDDQIVPFIKDAAKVVVSIFSLFFILGAIFQLNVASLIAGLGIGGLAVALAAKESLENLLGSFTIFLDKPFVIGDLIKVGNIEGTVEKIGFRSTRIRTAEKSYVTVPNKKMVDSELDNLSMRMQRLVKFNLGLAYGTSAKKVTNIINDIQMTLDSNPIIIRDETLIKLHNFNDTGIVLLVSYTVDSSEYKVYLSVRQEMNLKIMEIIEKHGSGFAHTSLDMFLANKLDNKAAN